MDHDMASSPAGTGTGTGTGTGGPSSSNASASATAKPVPPMFVFTGQRPIATPKRGPIPVIPGPSGTYIPPVARVAARMGKAEVRKALEEAKAKAQAAAEARLVAAAKKVAEADEKLKITPLGELDKVPHNGGFLHMSLLAVQLLLFCCWKNSLEIPLGVFSLWSSAW